MPTVRRTSGSDPANLGMTGVELDARVTQALAQVDMAASRTRPVPPLLRAAPTRRCRHRARDPRVVVLDEPSSNLDPAAHRELADVLLALDVTVVMVTHDLPYALPLCPPSVVLSAGVVVADGSTHDLLCDEQLMAAHRLEAAVSFDPRSTAVPSRTGARAAGWIGSLP